MKSDVTLVRSCRFFCTSKASNLSTQFRAGAQLLNGKKVSMAAADAMRARAAAQREKEDRLVLFFFFTQRKRSGRCSVLLVYCLTDAVCFTSSLLLD
jgi:hypothetical protein